MGDYGKRLGEILQRTAEPFIPFFDVLEASNPGSAGIVGGAIRFLVSSGGLDDIGPADTVRIMEKTAGELGFRELDQLGRLKRSQKNAFTERVVMAMFGGIALIGPMLIMTLHPSRNTSLIIVSVATFAFAIALAFVARDSAGKDVLGATAAYAAVLVVFVGTSTTPATS